jgi:cysteine desulfurase family protein (TIGR01976 family)
MNSTTMPRPARAADLDSIRAAFPALARRVNGREAAFFDGPGGTQVPQVVAAAVSDYLLNHNANSGWEYETSRETDQMLADARSAFADFLAASPDEIVFGPNMTTLTFHLARALGRKWGPGDEIVVSELDHHANVDSWKALAIERGLAIRAIRFDPKDATLRADDIESLIGPKTRLVAIGAASNALGTINDVRAIADRAHAHGALVFVDAVHYAAHGLVDVKALGADFLACSPYKFYGPHLGVLFGRKALIEGLSVPKVEPASNAAPQRLQTGTQSHEGIVGAAAAVDFIASLAGDGGSRRERLARSAQVLHGAADTLFADLWNGLAALPRVRLYGRPPGAGRTQTLAFTVSGMPSGEVCRRLGDAGLFLSNGDFYAMTAVARLGCAEEGVARAGLACYSSAAEVARLVAAVAALG